MTNKTDSDENASSESALRDAAEGQRLKFPDASTEIKDLTPEEIIHELRVHQIELEMQNEELRRIQTELENSKNNYQDLYDFAPVGYFTVSRKGMILQVNLTGASLLGVPCPKLINLEFGHFVTPESESDWYQHLIDAVKQEEKQSCVLTLRHEDGSSFYARLESIRMAAPIEPQGENSGGYLLRTAVIDITKQKMTENALVLKRSSEDSHSEWNHGKHSICQRQT